VPKETEVLLERPVSQETMAWLDPLVSKDKPESKVPEEKLEKQVPPVPQERRDGEVLGESLDPPDELEPLEQLVLTEHEEHLAVEDTPEPEVWPAQTDHQEPTEKPELQDQLETPDREDHQDNPDTEDQRDHQDHEVLQDQLSKLTSIHQRHCHPRALHTDHQSTTTTTTTTITNTTTPCKISHERPVKTWTCSISSMV